MTTPATLTPSSPAAMPPDLLADALACGRDSRPNWRQRHDGWTPDRIRRFLDTLAETGVVTDAARAAEMSVQSAYVFRNSARGRAFDVAWHSAQLRGRQSLADDLVSRARYGHVERLTRDGVVVAERHRYDNRLAMAVLTRLDALAASSAQSHEAARIASEEFEAFVDAVCEGPSAAAEFIRSRAELPDEAFDEENIIARNQHHAQSSLSLLGEGGGGAGEGDQPQAGGGGSPAVEGEDDQPTSADGDQAPKEGEEPASAERVQAPNDEEATPPKIYAIDCGWGPVQSDEQVAATERLHAALDEARRREGRDVFAGPADDRDAKGPRRLARRARRDRKSAPAEQNDDARAEEYNRLIPLMLQAAGLEGELDPDLLRIPLSTDPCRPAGAMLRMQQEKQAQSAPDEVADEGEWQPSTSSTLPEPEGPGIAEGGDPIPPTHHHEEQWILGDDGIAIKLVNGRIPPHHLRRGPRYG